MISWGIRKRYGLRMKNAVHEDNKLAENSKKIIMYKKTALCNNYRMLHGEIKPKSL